MQNKQGASNFREPVMYDKNTFQDIKLCLGERKRTYKKYNVNVKSDVSSEAEGNALNVWKVAGYLEPQLQQFFLIPIFILYFLSTSLRNESR